MKKNSELTYKEMYRQPASFQAVNDTLDKRKTCICRDRKSFI